MIFYEVFYEQRNVSEVDGINGEIERVGLRIAPPKDLKKILMGSRYDLIEEAVAETDA